MERKIKEQKGITLVALVITIIVMLILVAVSVTVAINGGLFTKAKEAGNSWEAQAKEEADGNIVKVNVDGATTTTTIDGAIESLSGTSTTQTPETTTITFTLDGTTYTTNEGTTWQKWVEEEYIQENSWAMYACREPRVYYVAIGAGMSGKNIEYEVCWTDEEGNCDNTRPVSPTEAIVDGAVYGLSW